ncbi:MAG: hypothetical protein A2189_06615, partial [Paenibacillus sp. RIFOXYA1_FULL_44_5]
QKGALNKKMLQKWQKQCTIDYDGINSIPARYPNQQDYPVLFAAMYDFLARAGIWQLKENEIVTDTKLLEQWLKQPVQQLENTLYDYWKQMFIIPSGWPYYLLIGLEQCPPEQWCLLHPVENWLDSCHIMKEEADVEQETQKWLNILSAIGWLELGRTEKDQQLVFRWLYDFHSFTSQAADHMPPDCLYIQPNFEVLVPPTVPLEARLKIDRMAERIHMDTISTYRLTRDRVYHALDHGERIHELIAFMERMTRQPLPDNIKITLEDWAAQHDQVFLQQALLLRAKDARTALELQSSPMLQPFIIEKLGELTFLVSSDADDLLSILLKQGYMPSQKIHTEAEHSDEQLDFYGASDHSLPHSEGREKLQLHYGDRGFIFQAFSPDYYQMVQEMPKLQDLYPELEKIPKRWMEEPRLYHLSTQIKMIQQAIQLQTYLLFRKGNQEYTFTPLSANIENGSWRIRGMTYEKEVILQTDEWEQIQLILPGINDHIESKRG